MPGSISSTQDGDPRGTGRRIATLDAYRGLTIVFIVAVIHPLFWIYITVPSPLSWLMVEMPILFALAGYAFGVSRSALGSPWVRYSINRLNRLLIPVAVYLAACTLLTAVMSIGSIGTAKDLLSAAVWWLPKRFHPHVQRLPFLGWHLWFLPVMIIVSSIFPAFNLVRRPERWTPMLLVWLSAACLLTAGSTLVHLPSTLRHSILYTAWAYTGFAWKRGWQPNAPQLLVTSGAALSTLLVGSALGFWTLNMQLNKFPASLPFLLFSVFAMPLVCRAATACSAFLVRLGQTSLLRPYVRYSYSCYLWQPVGILVFDRLTGRVLSGHPALRVVLSAPVALGVTALLGSLIGGVESFSFLKKATPLAIDKPLR